MNNIQIQDGEYGRRAVATSSWSQEASAFLRDNEIVELELNDGKGWRGDDLSFLADLPKLESFIIIDQRISSVEPIHFLHGLRSLEVITYCRSEIRFQTFPRLETCALEWRPKAASLFDCTNLKSLFVNCYDGNHTASFTKLSDLESLGILNAPVKSLHGISSLKKLRTLRLANLRRLASLDGIQGLVNLEELDIHTCRTITSIEEIGFLSRLRKIYLNNDGDIDSLKPLEKLSCLESVSFYESTNIMDGDLSPLLRQKHLARVTFKNRRHYSHRRDELRLK